jgi:hypothetical protein
MQNGIVFRDKNDDIWLGVYEYGSIRNFEQLSDYEGVYEDLPHTKFAFVEVEAKGEQVLIKDLCMFEMGRGITNDDESIEPATAEFILEDLEFPSKETDDMFGCLLSSAGKAN